MKEALIFLALCQQKWPTPPGIHHNLTMADDGKRLNISIWHNDLWWNYSLFDEALVEPAELVSRIEEVIDSQIALGAIPLP